MARPLTLLCLVACALAAKHSTKRSNKNSKHSQATSKTRLPTMYASATTNASHARQESMRQAMRLEASFAQKGMAPSSLVPECQESRRWAPADLGAVAAATEAPLILVHFHYFEPAGAHHCTLLNKRTNLAYFLKMTAINSTSNIKFVVTVAGAGLPSPKVFFKSIGVPAWGPEVLPKNVVLRLVDDQVTDLCHRARVLKEFHADAREKPSLILFLNDGARGPWSSLASPSELQVLNELALKLKVPVWLAQAAALLQAFPKASVVGAAGSCEEDVHVQSWGMLIKGSEAHFFRERYEVRLDDEALCL
ncbi:hypothetical protein M885DRAFT_496738 [Pelagophyceae sp. CCMP2097]|nr:hypothetical protein M885DRAFT_496738 [Pelagophyceae sp. CCMP2097]